LDNEGRLRPEIEVLDKLRTARLQTISIDSTVTSEATDPSWRGETRAIVEVRVRYNYGIDLKEMTPEKLEYLPGQNVFIVSVPRPTRSFEFPDAEPIREEVEAGWLRLRSMSGREQLLVAHKKLHSEADRKVISELELKRIEQDSLDTLRTLLSSFVSHDAVVRVKYEH
jgi:hypothetical protein